MTSLSISARVKVSKLRIDWVVRVMIDRYLPPSIFIVNDEAHVFLEVCLGKLREEMLW